MTTLVDIVKLETQVKQMYRDVAERPEGTYHFEVGRTLAERLGYHPDLLDQLPSGAAESFAGVGFVFGLAQPTGGDSVLDLGSGSGMDAFYAAHLVGQSGRVTGIDFTTEQLAKARRLAADAGVTQAEFLGGRIEDLPVADGQYDWVISNGVINLCPDKRQVFAEAARALRPGGYLAVSDIVTEIQLKESIVCDASLWASCIGGAAQVDDYRAAVEASGLVVQQMRPNPYHFLSQQARNASDRYGVTSITVLAAKPLSN